MLIRCLEIHNYAPELNKIHLVDGTIISAPSIKTIKQAEEFVNVKKRLHSNR